MKKEYVKPAVLVEEILFETMIATSNGNVNPDGGDTGLGGQPGYGDSNDRRGGWGNLWD